MPDANVIIRRYVPEDRLAIIEISRLALEYGGMPGHKTSLEHESKDIENIYFNNSGEFLVLLVDNQIIGIGGLMRQDNTTGRIRRMRIHPNYQRHGYGGLILGKLEQKAVELGYRKLVLRTSDKLKSAMNFYVKQGYKNKGVSPKDQFVDFEKLIY